MKGNRPACMCVLIVISKNIFWLAVKSTCTYIINPSRNERNINIYLKIIYKHFVLSELFEIKTRTDSHQNYCCVHLYKYGKYQNQKQEQTLIMYVCFHAGCK